MAIYRSQEWKDKIAAGNRRHGHGGHVKTKTYRAWASMRQRCGNPRSQAWPHYGGRGIVICERWQASYEAFLLDMGDPPSRFHSIGRRDNEKGYCKENCEWQTPRQQINNTRSNHTITAFGKTMSIAQWCDDPRCAANYHAIWKRLHYGWDGERAISAPVRVLKNNHVKKERKYVV